MDGRTTEAVPAALPSLTRRVRQIVVAGAFVFVALVAVAAWQLRVLITTDDALALTTDEVEAVVDARLGMSDMQAGVRGYSITGDERFLGPWDAGRVRADIAFARLALLADRDSSLDAALTTSMIALAATWRFEFAAPFVADVEAGMDHVELDGREADGKAMFDEFRFAADDLQLALSKRSVDLREDARRAQLTAVLALGLAALVVLGGALFALVMLRRHVLRPIQSLVDDVDRISAGDQPELNQATVHEFAMLEHALGDLDRSIADREAIERRARESIEQNATLALRLGSGGHESFDHDLGRVSAALRPAEGVVAGDAFRVGTLDDGRIAVTVLDVCGHGAEPALVAIRAREQIWASLAIGASPAGAITRVQAEWSEPGGMYITAFVATVDLAAGVVRYCGAGHPPAFVITRDGDHATLPPRGPLVGPLPEATWHNDHAPLPPGAQLVIYTDGITEARGRERSDFYGLERLASAAMVAAGSASTSGQTFAEALLSTTARFTRRLEDDATVVVVERFLEPATPAGSDTAIAAPAIGS